MSRPRFFAVLVPILTFALAAAPEAAALDRYAYSIGVDAVAGGPPNSEPDADLDNFGGQVVFGWQSELRTYVVTRAGQLSLDVDEGDGLLDSDLRWLTVSGEYRFSDAAWDSGLFVGIGFYEEEGSAIGDDSGLGLTLGTTARFPIVERLDLMLELAGHFTELERADVFVSGGAGVSFRF